MPEPAPAPRTSPPPMWPDTLPNPQANSMRIVGPSRAQASGVLTGPTRLRVIARTAPMSFAFGCWFTQAQMREFETWYLEVARLFDGEFYARWIGGGRIVAFASPYEYRALGAGYVLEGVLVRTRIDHSACDEFIMSVFGDIYRASFDAVDTYRASFTAVDIYRDQFDLQLVADNEC